MNLLAWRSRAGLCVMRASEQGAPCMHCLGERLSEAGFAPRGPVAVESDPTLLPLLAQQPAHPLAATVLRITAGQVSLHCLLAVPGCAGCAAAQARPHTAAPITAQALLDPLLGVGSWFQAVAPGDADASLCHALAGQVHTPGDRHSISARGQAMTAAGAALGHLGETVERYAAFRPGAAALVHARASELPAPALFGPGLFGLDAAQRAAVRHVALDGRRRIAWVEGRRITDGAARWVPAAAVWLARDWPGATVPEPRFCASVSHGLAAHRSAAQATAHAVLELHERACMTHAWHVQQFGTVLDPAGLDADGQALWRRAEAAGLKVSLRALAVPPAVPVVMALVWAERPPWFLFGAGAKASLTAAANAALLEACCGWQALVQRPEPVPRRFRLRQTEDARGHHRYYASAARCASVIRAFAGDASVRGMRWPRDDVRVDVGVLAQSLSPDVVVVDLTPPDCAAAGFSVQRVLAPGLPVYAFGRVGTPRLFAEAAGLPPAPRPHPFR